jgi:hypothetical protein
MGDQLASTADATYKEFVEASPQHQQIQKQGALGAEETLLLFGVHIGGLRRAMLFLAEQMEDPDLVGDAILDALRGAVATGPAD